MSARQRSTMKKARKPRDRVRNPKDPFPHATTRVLRSPLAPELKVQIPVSFVWTATSTATFLTQAYKINSLADSNMTYVGLGLFNTGYTKYRVTGATLHFDFAGASASTHSLYCASASPVSTAIASAGDVLTAALMPNSIGATCGLNSGASLERRSLSFAMTSVAGTDEVYTSDSYSAATSAVADPSDIIYLHLGFRFPGTASVSMTAVVVVRGHLDVQYFERKTIV